MTEGAMAARIFQVSVSGAGGGVPKRAVAGAVLLGPLGVEGDAVGHPEIHGGPERAVCLYALERILALQEEGHPIFPGAIGENVTTVGVDWDAVAPGTRWAVGEAEIEVASYTTPCRTTAGFVGGDRNRYHQAHNPGWSRVYARVLKAGTVVAGAPIRRLE